MKTETSPQGPLEPVVMDHFDATLRIEYDQPNDILTVNGISYSGHLFRSLALCEPGTWLRFESRSNGAICVYAPGADMERTFDVMTGKGAACGA